MTVKLTLFDTGFCTAREHLAIADGQRRPCEFHALVALLEHPRRGLCLFDTGYTPRFYSATADFPYRLYAWLTPVTLAPSQSIVQQLQARGIAARDIQQIIISHFHADHIGGLCDFPQAQFVCAQTAYRSIAGKTGWAALLRGFLPGLLPADLAQRMHAIETCPQVMLAAEFKPFTMGYDLWGDRSVLAIPLEGHAHGQMGLLVETTTGPVFLVADACWLSRAYRENRLPSWRARLSFAHRRAYRDNFARVHALHRNNPTLPIWPTHCPEVCTRAVPQTGTP